MKHCSEALLLTLVYVTFAPAVSEASSVTGYLGGDVILPCQVEEPQTNITQVQWDFMGPEGKNNKILVFNPQFGADFSDSLLKDRVDINEHSLTIKNVEETDAGTYTCRAAAYPSGSYLGIIHLKVQEEPSFSPAVNYAMVVVPLLLGILAALAYLAFRYCSSVRRHVNADTSSDVMDASRCEDVVYSEVKLKTSSGSITPSSHRHMTTVSEDVMTGVVF